MRGERGYSRSGHCWFARDVTATMLVVKEKKNKNISLLLELNPIFIENPLRKNSIVMSTNMAAFFTWLKAKNQGGRTVRTCIFNKSAALSIHPMSGFNHCWQLPVENETTSSKISKKLSLFGNS